ncbi:MAG: hypothetical protein IJ412_04845 [Oscillospiraceae bacterium]|nr:hypothetical protein [Oscillospiraceae bacterium]
MNTPSFWKTDLTSIESAWQSAEKAAEKRILCRSAGGRPVYMLAYGEKKSRGTANYSSALGAHDKGCYVPRAQKPAVILIGAVHGQETEGVAALMELISLLETGCDLHGQRDDALLALVRQLRLVIVPVANPDGRARVQPDAMVGCSFDDLRYWGQGTWKDGSLCGWPACKRIHPIAGHTDFLGGYYNDDGINLMHDNFFHPMAAETQAILDLCEQECADLVIHLHGGGNCPGNFIPTHYVTLECCRFIEELGRRCNAAGMREGMPYVFPAEHTLPQGENPPSFNLVSACHHVCGGVSLCYESNEGLTDADDGLPGFDHDRILRMHRILFAESLALVQGK